LDKNFILAILYYVYNNAIHINVLHIFCDTANGRENLESSFHSSDQNKLNQNNQNFEDDSVTIEIVDSDYETINEKLFYDSSVQSFCHYSCLSFLILAAFCIIIMCYFTQEKQKSNPAREMRSFLTHLQDSSLNSSWSQAISQYDDSFLVVPLKMTNFTKKMENKEEWNSSFIFAFHGHGGYKMYLRVNAAGHGDGLGTHVSVYLYNVKGPYDDELQQSILHEGPLEGTFTIELLNQYNSSNHYAQHIHIVDGYTDPVEETNEWVWEIPQFISYDVLLSDGSNSFLKNDSLFFRVDFDYERHPFNLFSYIMEHLKWTLVLDVYVLGFVLVVVSLDWRGDRGNNIFGNTIASLILVFAIVGIGSFFGGILWLILTIVGSVILCTSLDAAASKIFNRYTLINDFANSGAGVMVSLILNSFLVRVLLIDVFSFPHTLRGWI